jgi:hypothetical protein
MTPASPASASNTSGLPSGLRRLRLALLDSARVSLGWIAFLARRRTPPWAYHSMRRLFCTSAGVSNDLMAGLISLASRRYVMGRATGVIGDLGDAGARSVAGGLREHGYHVFEPKLSAAHCAQILELSLARPALITSGITPEAREGPRLQRYDRTRPAAVLYALQAADLVESPVIQSLMADEALIAVAQAYLKAPPVLDDVSLWWSTAQPNPDPDVGQLYHFDLDRIRWLKFFFYITDVTPENGPHRFVRGSHRRFGIPHALRSLGSVRLTDAQVAQAYSPSDIVEFTGQAGTIIAEDTRGLHKGRHVERGDRLVLQLEFTSSLFGAEYTQIPRPAVVGAELARAMKVYPGVYSLVSRG